MLIHISPESRRVTQGLHTRNFSLNDQVQTSNTAKIADLSMSESGILGWKSDIQEIFKH